MLHWDWASALVGTLVGASVVNPVAGWLRARFPDKRAHDDHGPERVTAGETEREEWRDLIDHDPREYKGWP